MGKDSLIWINDDSVFNEFFPWQINDDILCGTTPTFLDGQGHDNPCKFVNFSKKTPPKFLTLIVLYHHEM